MPPKSGFTTRAGTPDTEGRETRYITPTLSEYAYNLLWDEEFPACAEKLSRGECPNCGKKNIRVKKAAPFYFFTSCCGWDLWDFARDFWEGGETDPL